MRSVIVEWILLAQDGPLMGTPAPNSGVSDWWPILSWLIPVVLTGAGSWWLQREKSRNEIRLAELREQTEQASKQAAVEIESIKASLEQQKLLFETMHKQYEAALDEDRKLREELRLSREALSKRDEEIAELRTTILNRDEEIADLRSTLKQLTERLTKLETNQ